MALYDNYLYRSYPKGLHNFLIFCNQEVISDILNHLPPKKKYSFMEIGPGKGHFYEALKKSNVNADYSALDRNPRFLKQLKNIKTYISTLPKLPKLPQEYDVIYAAYVIEHLKNGVEVYDFIQQCRSYLSDGGLLVLFFPDVLQQKFEFWNIDYTHQYPTTKRNVELILREAGFTNIEQTDISGLLTVPGFTHPLISFLLYLLTFWYWYPLWDFLFKWLSPYPLHNPNNIWYRLYCLIREENVYCIAKNTVSALRTSKTLETRKPKTAR